MITGFGNNVVSALAADITANQTTIQVMPGTGALFSGLLTYDYSNTSNNLQTYAKITLTDAKETVFEICHLTAVNNDILTVIRAQEGTTAKGWSLNDVIGNFATRGSENQFVQIEQLQSGHYISGVAGGTANALTLELPATYFANGSTDWTLRTPIVVYPTQNNTGAATLQLTMGGRVLGTFKLYKGNKAELVANDILKDTGLVCLLDNTKTFFNVMNPGAIYAGLGTAAFHDVQTSQDDVTPGRVLVNGGAVAVRRVFAINEGVIDDANNLPTNAVSFVYGDAKNSPNGNSGTILDVSGLGGGYNLQLFVNYQTGNILAFRSYNGDNRTWNNWNYIYSTGYKPTAVDVGALPITGGTLNGNLKVDGCSAKNINIYDVVPTGGYLINHYNPSGANRCAYGYYSGNFDIHFYNDVGTWVSNPVSIHPNGDCFFGSVYDQGHRVYSPNNPQPIDLSAYATQSWVLQNFVQSIDLTAPAEVGFWDGNGYTRATDGAAMYNFKMVGGSSNVGNYIIRYTRRLVNNVWYVIN